MIYATKLIFGQSPLSQFHFSIIFDVLRLTHLYFGEQKLAKSKILLIILSKITLYQLATHLLCEENTATL